MKGIITIIITASILGLPWGCKKQECVRGDGATGSLSLSVDGFATKATKATEPNQGSEDNVRTAQLMLFNGEDLYRYKALTAAEIAGVLTTGTPVTITDIKTGNYTVVLVANGPELSSVRTLTSLNAMTAMLGEYDVTTSGFLMTGTGNVTVTEDATAIANVTLTHRVARVKVSKITNSLPSACGSLTVNSIMLTNVYGTWLLMGGKPLSPVWYNREGREDGNPRVSSHIIDGFTYKSSCPDLLWRNIGTDVSGGASFATTQYLYAFPNDATAAPNGFKQPFNAQRTCVVLIATVNSKTWYYPVVLDGALESNKSYDVQYDITGYGSADPNKPVTSGTMTASVTVKDWTGTKTYNDNI